MSWVTDVALSWAKSHSAEIIQWVIDRMQERNTWQGIAAMLGSSVVYLHLTPDEIQAFVAMGLAIGGFVAVVKKEGVKK